MSTANSAVAEIFAFFASRKGGNFISRPAPALRNGWCRGEASEQPSALRANGWDFKFIDHFFNRKSIRADFNGIGRRPKRTDRAASIFTIAALLGSQAGKLAFEVSLNTHSVDLSMDLAALATLAADTGLTVQADAWDAPRGGHHVSGTLSFPSSVDGKEILDGAAKLTLTIKDVDVPERTFAWDLR